MTPEANIYFEEWDSEWEGRFRKVQVEVTVVYADPDKTSPNKWLIEEAKKCAKRLVGADATVSWKDVTNIKIRSTWTRFVTVERKI